MLLMLNTGSLTQRILPTLTFWAWSTSEAEFAEHGSVVTARLQKFHLPTLGILQPTIKEASSCARTRAISQPRPQEAWKDSCCQTTIVTNPAHHSLAYCPKAPGPRQPHLIPGEHISPSGGQLSPPLKTRNPSFLQPHHSCKVLTILLMSFFWMSRPMQKSTSSSWFRWSSLPWMMSV